MFLTKPTSEEYERKKNNHDKGVVDVEGDEKMRVEIINRQERKKAKWQK